MKLKKVFKSILPENYTPRKYDKIIKKEKPRVYSKKDNKGITINVTYYLYTLESYCEKSYDEIVNELIREKYSADKVEAILSNYLNNPMDDKYKLEFNSFQAYRQECKTKAKVFVFEREQMIQNKN